MPTFTTNFEYQQPLVNNATDADLWGEQLNQNWEDIDTNLAKTTSVKAADFNILETEFNFTYLIDASGGTVTGTLPSTIPFNGFTVRFKALDASNTITIDGNGNNIDGSASQVIVGNNVTLQIVSDGTQWRISVVAPVSTETVSGTTQKATKAELEAETADKNITSDNALNHPGVAKAWGYFDATSGSVSSFQAEYNMTSVSRLSTGRYELTMDNAMDSNNYVVVGSGTQVAGIGGTTILDVQINSSTEFILNTENADSSQRDSEVWFVVYGTLA